MTVRRVHAAWSSPYRECPFGTTVHCENPQRIAELRSIVAGRYELLFNAVVDDLLVDLDHRPSISFTVLVEGLAYGLHFGCGQRFPGQSLVRSIG